MIQCCPDNIQCGGVIIITVYFSVGHEVCFVDDCNCIWNPLSLARGSEVHSLHHLILLLVLVVTKMLSSEVHNTMLILSVRHVCDSLKLSLRVTALTAYHWHLEKWLLTHFLMNTQI